MYMSIMLEVLQIIMPIIVVCFFTFVFLFMFSPKFRAKFFAHQMKAEKYMLEENEEMLKDINRRSANVSKDGVEITARALKKGLSGETIYCKHCGNSIDADSKFCKDYLLNIYNKKNIKN